MRYIGDFNTSSIIRGLFNTRTAAGVPITLGGTPSLSVYKSNSTTESTAGVTLTVDFDSRTGLHFFAIDTSADGTFYAAGEDYRIVVTAGTVDSVSVVGHVVAVFSLANRSALRPTTAGRTLDVTATGEAGIDWANVGSPTTTLNLSGTTIKTATDVETDTADIQARLPAALVSGRIDASVGAMAANALTASALATDAVGEIVDAVWDEATSGHTTAGTTGKALTDATAPTAAAVADAVWDEALSGHLAAGSTGEALNAAGAAGDPWTTTLPGAYTGSQAGKMLSDILVDTGTTLQAELDGIQADTEDIQARLPAALVSGRMDASVGAMAANTLTASALATDAVTEIQNGLATPTNITAGTITTVTNLTNAPTAGDLTATMKASVNAEVLDVLNVDTFAELSSPPAATSSLRAKLTWLFMWARNRSTQTSTERKLYADDATTVVGTESVSDDGTTYSKGEAT